MARKAKSRTEKDAFLVEALVGLDHHKTTISDGYHSVEAHANTPEKAEERASKKWKERKGR